MNAAQAEPARSPFRLNGRQLVPILILPILLVNAISFLWPTFSLLRMSLNEPVAGGAIRETLTLQTYIDVMTDGFYLELVWNSIYLCSIITIVTLILSYPIALFIHRADPKWRSILTLMVISPLLVSAVVRTYGWVIILGDQGLINAFLMSTGLVERPARLIFNNFGVVVGLIEILMPYMILSLMAGFGRLDPRLEEAAQSLGAKRFTTLRRVTIPLTAPGIALGCLLVFVLSISSFVTPKLLGGGRVFLLATEIYDQSIVLLNWPLAASLSMLVLVIFGAALVVYSRIVKALD
ncbi:ABC transporter permease subunit [Aliihoeflea aestuarii]|jgi:putative spermidine/putrescine transport system permease protein|uniref:ABC transporter permease n=1 Tax=Aliihoeflea aestuarii TaxID=453840 RepID=UPI0020925239|nr:ABC transporter permease [Aliihoeflea aestuarii]MCO6390851.1 ABC transporter permease subunit [Aliihoeflea aestuarii]